MKIYPFDLSWANRIKLLERWLDYWLKITELGLEMKYEVSLSDLTSTGDACISSIVAVDFYLHADPSPDIVYTGLVSKDLITGDLRVFTKKLILDAYEGLCNQQK